MNSPISSLFQRTAIVAVAAISIGLPGVASAGLAKNVKAKTSAVAAKARSNKRVAAAFDKAQDVPGADIVRKVWDMRLGEQLDDMLELLEQIEADYQYFTGGEKCGAECSAFRNELKSLLNDFASLVTEIPVLGERDGLAENVQRTVDLIDRVPPRTLYLLWQALSDKLQELRAAASEIRQIVDSLPTLQDVSGDGFAAMVGDSVCDWAEADRPFVELVQARLAYIAWVLRSVADIVPDVEVKGEAGGEGGLAVANVTGSAGMGMKPTDVIKIQLKTVAMIPEEINWAIKINLLRAMTVCRIAGVAGVRG